MRDRDELTRLSHWFPKLQSASLPGLLMPKTRIVVATDVELASLQALAWGDDATGSQDVFAGFVARLRVGALEVWDHQTGGFLRTDFTSGKHEWSRTCRVPSLSEKVLGAHVTALAEHSECVDMFGLPYDTWAVRELLPVSPAFHAFRGMPIVREVRVFVRDGRVEHVQPYWPPSAFTAEPGVPSDAVLEALNFLGARERLALEAQSKAVGAVLGGYWSVDWLQTAGGQWALTDMAEGDKSFRWEPETGKGE